MKKLIAIMLVMVLVLSLAACGGNSNTPSGNSSTSTPPANNSTTPPASQGNDNPTSAPPSSTPDTSSAITFEWPENDYTKQIPKAPDSIKLGESYEMQSQGNFTVQFADEVDNDTLKAYADELKGAGFTSNANEGDDPNGHYFFNGYNNAGYKVVLYHTSVTVTKPK